MTVSKILYVFLSTFVLYQISIINCIPFTNLFNPYDILLFKPIDTCRWFDLDVTYEGAFHSKAFQADPEDKIGSEMGKHSNVFARPASILNLWNENHNFAAALKGSRPLSNEDKLAHLFNIKSEKINPLLVDAHLSVPVNLMFAARFAFTDNLSLGIYLPFFILELKNIVWKNAHTKKINMLDELESLGKFNLTGGWKRHGIGDIATIIWWARDYAQRKEWLKNVHVSIRGGLTFPTGLNQDFNKLLALPFGNDGGIGLLFGGTIELGLGYHFKVGIDGEFLHLFGSTRERRFATDIKQSDLIFLQKTLIHRDPGFLQHYTLYLKWANICEGLSTRLAYQYVRQHEDHVVLNTPLFDNEIANNAESLQGWTTHSIIWFLDYDLSLDSCLLNPKFSIFVKKGFNGKRALLFDTAGIQLSLSF